MCKYKIYRTDLSNAIQVVKQASIQAQKVALWTAVKQVSAEEGKKLRLDKKREQTCTEESTIKTLKKDIALNRKGSRFSLTAEEASGSPSNQVKRLEQQIKDKISNCNNEIKEGYNKKSADNKIEDLKKKLLELKNKKYTFPLSCSITADGISSSSSEYSLPQESEWQFESSSEPSTSDSRQRVFNLFSKKDPNQKLNIHCISNSYFNLSNMGCAEKRGRELKGINFDIQNIRNELFELGLDLNCVRPSSNSSPSNSSQKPQEAGK